MFQSEHLQEKWAPLLDYEGLDSIKDSHRKTCYCCPAGKPRKVFKRREAQLRYQPDGNTSTMAGNAAGQPTGNPATTAGFGANATAAGPVAGFDPVLISLIRRAMPNLVAYDLAGVQPNVWSYWTDLCNALQI